MHQICYSFYWSIKKWSRLCQKADFLAQLGSFFVYALLHPMINAPKFRQMKGLIKIYTFGKFHQHSICGCEGKNFQSFSYWFSIHEMTPFGVFWPLLLQKLFVLVEILTRGSLPIRQTQCLKNPSKFWILAQMERTQSLPFWSISGPNLPLENQKYCLKPKFLQKLHL